MSDRDLIARLDRLTDAIERQQRTQLRALEQRTAQPTHGEQVRRNTMGTCPHGEERGSRACPLCRRGIRS